jgi:predicted DNA-binding ribbon-helix-helix protein
MEPDANFEKRSVSLEGHRTSVSLEHGFWSELERIARREGRSLASLIAFVDRQRGPDQNLASALRLHVLRDLRNP